MKTNLKPIDIYHEYEDGVAYNTSIGLYDTVKQNEQFYLGRQWEGLVAPDLDKPVLNFLKRVSSYIVAMLVSDDIGIELTPFHRTEENEHSCELLKNEIEQVIERAKAKTLTRDMLRNCVVDGDGCFYWYFDPFAGGPQAVKGEVKVELVDNTRVLFGNPFVADVQKQPYIILVKREQIDAVRERAAQFGGKQTDIKPDHEGPLYSEEGYNPRDLVTVLVKLYRKDGRVYFTEVTRDAVVRPETDTGYTLYPVSYMNFEKVKNSYHGQALITGLIPNQIAVNKLWAMAIHHQHTMAFPKIFYDRMKIKQWSNRVGEAIGVSGNPNEAVTAAFRAPDMSAQLTEIVDRTIQYTKEFMGASDAVLGTVKPDNASAIIAVQKATAAPLELQKLSLYQFVEDYVRIVAEMICAHYGSRVVTYTDADGEQRNESFDFGTINLEELALEVNIGASSYWSELTQLGTLDNLFAKGVITDALLYLESVPDSYIKNKNKIMAKLKEQGAGMLPVPAAGKSAGQAASMLQSAKAAPMQEVTNAMPKM